MSPPDAQRPPAGEPRGEQDTDADIGSTDDISSVEPESVCCDAHAARAYRSEATIPIGHQWLNWGRTYRPTYIKPGPVVPRPKLPEVAA